MRRLFRVKCDLAGNLPALPAVYPDTIAPVIHAAQDGERELSLMRWGFPATAEPRQGASHQCVQLEVALLARMAEGGMVRLRAGDFVLRVNRQPAEGHALVGAGRGLAGLRLRGNLAFMGGRA